MDQDIIIRLNSYFGQNGLIFHSKLNEYYKMPLPKFDEIKRLYETIDSNPQYSTLDNRLCYISCCLYFLSKTDESFKSIFLQKVLKSLNIKSDAINDSYLFLIYNCIDFDENFLHSMKEALLYLSKYLQKFSEFEKERSIALLYKYYNAILNYRLGKREEATKECFGIISQINEKSSDKIINFISLKNQLFLAKMSIENENVDGMSSFQENYNLLKGIYDRTLHENPFLALKIGFSIFNNLYNRNLFVECLQILEEMHDIIKNYERLGVSPIKLSRFILAIFCRYGIIGLILADIKYISFAIEGITTQLLLLKSKFEEPKVKHIFKAYSFCLTLLKLNSGRVVDDPAKMGEIFKSEFDKPNKSNYCLNNEIINQSIINFNALNKNMNIAINEKSYKLVEYYSTRISNPEKNYISNNIVFTFVIGMHDRVRYLIEQYLTEKDKKNESGYKNQIIKNCETFWNFMNANVERIPLLNSNFIKSIIIKLFSSCFHIYYINKDFNTMTQILNYFENNLSKKLTINENTPSYDLVLKVKGDFYFYKNDYNNSINYYNHSVQLMNDKNPKKAIVYFNLGVLYYYINNKSSSIENMKKAAEYFRRSEIEKYSFDFHKRNNNLSKKYIFTNSLINKIQSS